MFHSLNPEEFRKVFDSYFLKWSGVAALLYVAIFGTYTVMLFGVYTYDKLPAFLYPMIEMLEYSDWVGGIPIGGKHIGGLTFGAVSVGVVSIGAFSVGIVSIGAFSVGIFAFGAYSVGIFTFAGGTRLWRVGIRGSRAKRGIFNMGKAVGVIAVSPEAYGVYTLSYSGGGCYSLSPDRHDAEAVAFFTRWLPKFKRVFS